MRRHLRPIMFILGMLFIVVLVIRSWDELQISEIAIPLFIISLLLAIIGNFFTSMFFKALLGKYGAEINNRLSHKIFFYGQIAKYIPGKIWGIIYQSMMIPKPGTTGVILFSNLDLMAIQIVNCTIIALVILTFQLSTLLSITITILGLGVCLLLAQSCASFKFISRFPTYSKFLMKNGFNCTPNIRPIVAIGYYCLFWITYFGSHFLMLSAAFDFSASKSAMYVALLCLSWVIGVLALISPAGLGIREFVFVFLAQLTSQEVSLDTVAAIAVVARFWFIIQELMGAGIVSMYDAIRSRNTSINKVN